MTAPIGSKPWCEQKIADLTGQQINGRPFTSLTWTEKFQAIQQYRFGNGEMQVPRVFKGGLFGKIETGVDGLNSPGAKKASVVFAQLIPAIAGFCLAGFVGGAIGVLASMPAAQAAKRAANVHGMVISRWLMIQAIGVERLSQMPVLTSTTTMKGIEFEHLNAPVMKGYLPEDEKSTEPTPFIVVKRRNQKGDLEGVVLAESWRGWKQLRLPNNGALQGSLDSKAGLLFEAGEFSEKAVTILNSAVTA